jgi:signal peptide peptidase SppA
MRYARIVAEVCSRAWALREETLWAMQELIRLQASGVKWSADEIRERIAESNAKNGYVRVRRNGARFLSCAFDKRGVAFDQELEMEAASGRRSKAAPGSVALIPVMGVIAHRMSMMDISGPGGTSIQQLTAQIRQALEDGNCKAIVLDVDSPGGSVEGVMELASEIYDARKQKPITAVCNSMACSAAYWLASAASEVVVTPSGQCGSIGVYMLHQDESEALAKDGIKITVIKAGKYKAEGNPSEPLSEEARAAFQSKVDEYYGMFVKAVGKNRGVSQAAVREGYGQGRSLLANDAVKQNLADRIGTLDDVLGKYGVKNGGASAADSRSSVAAKQPEDEEDDSASACSCNCSACQSCENKGAGAHAHAHAHAHGLHADDMSCQCGCEACKACSYKSDVEMKAEDAAPAAEPDGDEPDAPEPEKEDEPCDCNCAVCQGCEFKTTDTPEERTGIQPDSATVCECDCETCKACVNKASPPPPTIQQTAGQAAAARKAAGAGLAAIQRRRRELSLL